MPFITEIRKDAELVTALQAFNLNCNNNKVVLGLTAADLTEIGSAATSAQTQLNNWEAAKTAARASRVTKSNTLKASKSVVSKWAKVFHGNQAVPDSVLSQLMLPPHNSPRTNTPPTQPLALVASADGNGNIELRWKRNGNIAGTTFLIEYRLTATAAWSILGSTTKAKFFHTSAPGSYIEFRVTAQRADNESLPSTSVVLWGGSGSGESFELKAA